MIGGFPLKKKTDPPAAEPGKFDAAAAVSETLRMELATLLDATQADISGVVAEITPMIVQAASEGKTELTAEMQAQLWAVVELNQIRASKAAWRTIKSLSSVAVKGLSVGLKMASGGALPLMALLLAFGCATASVDTAVANGLLVPVIGRVDAYAAKQDLDWEAKYAAEKAGLALLMSGERTPGPEAKGLVFAICDWHDSLVFVDPSLSKLERETYMRSTKILRMMFTEASTTP